MGQYPIELLRSSQEDVLIEVRLLKAEEYGLMDEIPVSDRVKVTPDNTMVAGAFEGNRLVGRLILVNVPHLECVWIAPEYRGATILKRMTRLLTHHLGKLSASKAFAFAINEQMEDYCRRLGFRRFATAWMKEI